MNSEMLLNNLPPDVREMVAKKMAAGDFVSQPGPPPQTQPQAPVKQPTLLDHLIALRQEVDMMRQEMAQLSQQISANSDVVMGVGQATGQLWQMFQASTDQSASYSSQFQAAQPAGEDY